MALVLELLKPNLLSSERINLLNLTSEKSSEPKPTIWTKRITASCIQNTPLMMMIDDDDDDEEEELSQKKSTPLPIPDGWQCILFPERQYFISYSYCALTFSRFDGE